MIQLQIGEKSQSPLVMFDVELFARRFFAFRQLSFEIFQHRQNIFTEEGKRDRWKEEEKTGTKRTFLLTRFEDIVVALHGDHQCAKASIDFEEDLIRSLIEMNESVQIIDLDPEALHGFSLLENAFDVLQGRFPFGDLVEKGSGRLIRL